MFNNGPSGNCFRSPFVQHYNIQNQYYVHYIIYLFVWQIRKRSMHPITLSPLNTSATCTYKKYIFYSFCFDYICTHRGHVSGPDAIHVNCISNNTSQTAKSGHCSHDSTRYLKERVLLKYAAHPCCANWRYAQSSHTTHTPCMRCCSLQECGKRRCGLALEVLLLDSL